MTSIDTFSERIDDLVVSLAHCPFSTGDAKDSDLMRRELVYVWNLFSCHADRNKWRRSDIVGFLREARALAVEHDWSGTVDVTPEGIALSPHARLVKWKSKVSPMYWEPEVSHRPILCDIGLPLRTDRYPILCRMCKDEDTERILAELLNDAWEYGQRQMNYSHVEEFLVILFDFYKSKYVEKLDG